MMIFRNSSICYMDNFMKIPQWSRMLSFYVSHLKRLDKFLISCDIVP